MTKPLQDGWIEWTGEGEPPTGPVEVRLRYGEEFEATKLGVSIDWTHIEAYQQNDIVAYRRLVDIVPQTLVAWLQSWWQISEAERADRRKTFGPDVAHLLRGVADMIEEPSLATPAKYGCHCDIETMDDGFEPDACVLDYGDIDDCVYAAKLHAVGKGKTDCKYWKPITMHKSIHQPNSAAPSVGETPRTDDYYAELRSWVEYCKRYPNMPPEQADQCPLDCDEEEFAKRLERELAATNQRIEELELQARDAMESILVVANEVIAARAETWEKAAKLVSDLPVNKNRCDELQLTSQAWVEALEYAERELRAEAEKEKAGRKGGGG